MDDSSGNRLALCLAMVFLVVGLGGVVAVWGAYLTDSNIDRDGSRTSGLLLGKRLIGTADGDSDYILDYRFRPDGGAVMDVSRSVGRELWMSVQEGQALEIRYSPDKPTRNFPAGAGVTSLGVAVFVSALAALLAALGGALIGSHLLRGRVRT